MVEYGFGWEGKIECCGDCPICEECVECECEEGEYATMFCGINAVYLTDISIKPDWCRLFEIRNRFEREHFLKALKALTIDELNEYTGLYIKVRDHEELLEQKEAERDE